MKIVMILDQVQSGTGTKDDTLIPLGGKKESIGPGLMMKPMFSKVDATVCATLYCGTGTYFNDKVEVTRKLILMTEKFAPDVVICGPSYNFPFYSQMAVELASEFQRISKIPVLCAMSEENADIIAQYKDSVTIVKMPKKGGFGLNDSLTNIAEIAKNKYEQKVINLENCY